MFIFEIIFTKLYGRFIFSVAFFQANHVHALNQIFHCDIHTKLGMFHDKKFCVHVSARFNHVANVILHISFDQDILAKYNHEKLLAPKFLMLVKLFFIDCHDIFCHIS